MNRTLNSELWTRPTAQFLVLVGVSQSNEMQTFIKLIFLFLMTNAIALKIYKSNIANNGEKIINGLHYKRQENENPILTNSLTTCIRFNLKKLGPLNNPGHIWNPTPLIHIPKNESSWFLGILAGYPNSRIFLNGTTSFLNMILHDLDNDNYLIWKLYTWHHICFSYSETNSQIRFVKVSSAIFHLHTQYKHMNRIVTSLEQLSVAEFSGE